MLTVRFQLTSVNLSVNRKAITFRWLNSFAGSMIELRGSKLMIELLGLTMSELVLSILFSFSVRALFGGTSKASLF